MKILISDEGSGAHRWERIGLARALNYAGHKVLIWNLTGKSAFDIFNEFEPDVFISQTYNINRAIYKCIESRPALYVAMKSGDFGPMTDNWSQAIKQTYPILIESKKTKDIILKLKEETGKPDFLFIHYHPEYLDTTHGNWRKIGFKVNSMMNAADVFDYTNGVEKSEYKADVVFVGGYWPYKAVTLDKYLLLLCNPKFNLKIRIFGNSNWGVPQYAGYAPDNEVKHIFKSATICPNISELHSQHFGFDIIERPFKLLSNKCFVISDNVEGLKKLFPDGIEYAKSPNIFLQKVEHYLKNPDERLPFIENGYKAVIKDHTYFDRARDMFIEFGLMNEALKMKIAKAKLIEELGL